MKALTLLGWQGACPVYTIWPSWDDRAAVLHDGARLAKLLSSLVKTTPS
jgi:hypothetical protein